MIRKKRYRKGFSLIEAVAATVIVGIAAAGLLVPFTSGMVIRDEGNQKTLAVQIANDLMERIVNTPFDSLAGLYGSYSEGKGGMTGVGGGIFTDTIYDNFSRKASCQPVTLSTENGVGPVKYILVTIVIYYNDEDILTVRRLITR